MTRIEVAQLRHTYPGPPEVEALRGVDLAVADGGLLAAVGPSGCGKTTLLRALAGTERPTGGTVRLDGAVVDGPGTHVGAEARRISLVPQEGALFPHLDVAGNIGFGLRRLDRRARRDRVGELLDLIGLPGAQSRRPHELSGGQQQRVALARALAPRPRAVLLDEPFSALDATLRVALREEVVTLLRSAGTTAVLVTHDRDEALSLADSVAVMHEGRVLQVGAPVEVYRAPASIFVAELLGDVVRLPAVLGGRPRGHGVGVVRPEQLEVDPEGVGPKATVVGVRFRGPEASIELRVDDDVLQARWSSTELPEVGDVVALRVRGPVVVLP